MLTKGTVLILLVVEAIMVGYFMFVVRWARLDLEAAAAERKRKEAVFEKTGSLQDRISYDLARVDVLKKIKEARIKTGIGCVIIFVSVIAFILAFVMRGN